MAEADRATMETAGRQISTQSLATGPFRRREANCLTGRTYPAAMAANISRLSSPERAQSSVGAASSAAAGAGPAGAAAEAFPSSPGVSRSSKKLSTRALSDPELTEEGISGASDAAVPGGPEGADRAIVPVSGPAAAWDPASAATSRLFSERLGGASGAFGPDSLGALLAPFFEAPGLAAELP